MNTVEIIRYLSNLSPIIPIILIFALGKDRFKIKTINLISVLILVSSLTDVITYIRGSHHLNTAFILNLYTLLEFTLLIWLYRELLFSHKKIIYLFIAIFIGFF